ncbi:hypothetical protein M404DRAFT_35601 [Pisolithus tinctorius Marx 270]|uniref:Uncharacterized protein n=1 Tax=Pisolithus tinctorius Marx 270 TaxID=870435 RepID=A0A0C3I9Z8_PISTI|nr:hypothetical protein M404DRAFT_35601 [Pisolithus tinctorius Marx 270]
MVDRLKIVTYHVDEPFLMTSFTQKDWEMLEYKCTLCAIVKGHQLKIKAFIGLLHGKEDILLRMPFLKEYCPHINWLTRKINQWDDEEEAQVWKTTLSTELEAALADKKEEVFMEDDIPLPHHWKELDHEI